MQCAIPIYGNVNETRAQPTQHNTLRSKTIKGDTFTQQTSSITGQAWYNAITFQVKNCKEKSSCLTFALIQSNAFLLSQNTQNKLGDNGKREETPTPGAPIMMLEKDNQYHNN